MRSELKRADRQYRCFPCPVPGDVVGWLLPNTRTRCDCSVGLISIQWYLT